MMKENAPFIAAPGEMFNYSNESYALLQEIIERASGEQFTTFAEKYIFAPLEMARSIFSFEELVERTNITELYAFTKETPKEVFHSPAWWASGSIVGAGALKSCAADVQKYLELFRQNGRVNGIQLVTTESMKTMKSTQVTTPNGVHYGYGLIVGSYHGQDIVGHGGGVKGISSYMLATDEITVTVLTNIAEVAAENIALLVLDEFLHGTEQKEKPAEEHHVITLLDDELQAYVGFYATNERQSVDVMLMEGSLYLSIQEQPGIKVKPVGHDQFVLPDGKKVTFIRDEQGKIYGVFRGMRLILKKE